MRDLSNLIVHRLTVLKFHESIGKGLPRAGVYWWCRCECGNELAVSSHSLTKTINGVRGGAKSCGCLAKEKSASRAGGLNRRHGETNGRIESPEYRCWKSIKTRCYNPRFKQFKDYGGRGIKVCARWLHSFESFLADMGRKPSPKHSIERRHVSDDYTPDNCYWATDRDQRRNKRTTQMITINGRSLCVTDWLRELGLSKSTYGWRRKQGWSREEALLGR